MLATEIKTGKIYKEGNDPYQVISYKHVKTARGGATVRVKVRNLISGSVYEKSYKSSATVDEADVVMKDAQYLYYENSFVFMDPETYEQIKITDKVLGESSKFLKEGEYFKVLYFEGKPVSVEFPNIMNFEVSYTEPGHKGNTVTNVFKDATLENELEIKVPMFIKIGDRIKVDTRTKEYVSKA